MIRPLLIWSLSIIASIAFANNPKTPRIRIDLKGVWEFRLDPANLGLKEKWFEKSFSENVKLPGTTDINKKGYINTDSTTMHLSRLYKYEGAAWYRKKVKIPRRFKDKHVELFLERTKPSTVWVDGKLIGESFLLQSPHVYDLSIYLTPGDHDIVIRIDNTLSLTPYGNVHIYSEDTQTNWNGILGEIYLEAAPGTFISDLKIFPDIDSQKVDVKLYLKNRSGLKLLSIDLYCEKIDNGNTKRLKPQSYQRSADSVISLAYLLGTDTELWDEFNHSLYKIIAKITYGKTSDLKSATFGMRKFSTKGTQFTINGKTTFLRGKHDAAVFPITGYAPMDLPSWIKVFAKAKDYGINHYRFHSWCPPEAAFAAADRVGMYLQVELPFWGGLDNDTTASKLKTEGFAMLKSYANHPSFVMFSPGNEIWGGHDRVERNTIAFKVFDSRPLYTMGSNVNIGYVSPQRSSDYFVGSRTPSNGDTTLTHTRLTHAFADSKEGGLLNAEAPSTQINFSYPVSQIRIPIVSHEIGQYQIYPDYKEIDKYTGVLRAWNLEIFKKRLIAAGLMEQNEAFQKASGAWAALCYKAEMEAAIRTPGFGGFQLLDLQDFPGQGTALIGILDAFMDSKNIITTEKWRESCNDVVLLAEFPKYCWTSKEVFFAKVKIANYSNRDLTQPVNWEVFSESGALRFKGSFSKAIAQGGVVELGTIKFPLSSLEKAEKVTITISGEANSYRNSYSIWAYTDTESPVVPKNILVGDKLDAQALQTLNQGGRVLLFPGKDDFPDKTLKGLFPPDFWNWGMFKGISEGSKKSVSPGTLGLLMDPNHPVFNSFPTDFHTNWQWYSIIKEGNVMDLGATEKGYKPLIQVIDNVERNLKLGLLFEFKVGKGRLLVCMARLNRISGKPEAAQLFKSILNYMNSDRFNPVYPASFTELSKLLPTTNEKL